MINIPKFLFRCSLFAMMPVAANAAGTYYNGNYQSPQQQRYMQPAYTQRQGNYTQTSTYNRSVSGPANMNPYANRGQAQQSRGAAMGQNNPAPQNNNQARQQNNTPAQMNNSATNGFFIDAGISREVAMWRFDMNESDSILHYDNINWNVFDLKGGYKFTAGNTPMQIDAGFKYGIQSGDATMVDDDITNGGYFITQWVTTDNTVIGEQIGHALSVGSSKDGNMYGFNIGFGLTDFVKWGNMKITPSIGYRYFKYKLETKNNYGLSVDTSACFRIDGSDEIQCDPIIIFYTQTGTDSLGNPTYSEAVVWGESANEKIPIHAGATNVGAAGTYYYYQPGTSHSYEVEWSGPYLALDMDYAINQNNNVNGHVELGLPGYKATGDQPYRFDWAHPKSVEDKAGIGSAFHFGLGANWTTALSDRVALSVGLTFDYYTVNDADAKTYLNKDFYGDMYDAILNEWEAAGLTASDMLNSETGDKTALSIKELESECPGWVCSSNGEIESFYKSMGIRVGLVAKF